METNVSSAGFTGANFDTGRFASTQGVPGLTGTAPPTSGSGVQGAYTGGDAFVKGGDLNSSYAGNAVFTNALNNDRQMEKAMNAAMARDAAKKAATAASPVMASTPVNDLPAAQSGIHVQPAIPQTFTTNPATSYVAAPGGGYAPITQAMPQLVTPTAPGGYPLPAATVPTVDPRYYTSRQGDSLMISGRGGTA